MATGNARDLLTVQDQNPDPTACFTLFTDCRGHNAFNIGEANSYDDFQVVNFPNRLGTVTWSSHREDNQGAAIDIASYSSEYAHLVRLSTGTTAKPNGGPNVTVELRAILYASTGTVSQDFYLDTFRSMFKSRIRVIQADPIVRIVSGFFLTHNPQGYIGCDNYLNSPFDPLPSWVPESLDFLYKNAERGLEGGVFFESYGKSTWHCVVASRVTHLDPDHPEEAGIDGASFAFAYSMKHHYFDTGVPISGWHNLEINIDENARAAVFSIDGSVVYTARDHLPIRTPTYFQEANHIGTEIRDNTHDTYTNPTVATIPTIIDIDYSMFRGFPNR